MDAASLPLHSASRHAEALSHRTVGRTCVWKVNLRDIGRDEYLSSLVVDLNVRPGRVKPHRDIHSRWASHCGEALNDERARRCKEQVAAAFIKGSLDPSCSCEILLLLHHTLVGGAVCRRGHCWLYGLHVPFWVPLSWVFFDGFDKIMQRLYVARICFQIGQNKNAFMPVFIPYREQWTFPCRSGSHTQRDLAKSQGLQ